METEDDLHTLWATLLATALDAKGAEVHRKFVSILSDLTSADAAVLELLWKDWLVVDMEPFKSSATVTYGPGVSGSDKHDEASMVTINRLGLVSPNYVEITTYQPPGHDGDYKEPRTHEDNARAYGDLMTVAFTPLGIAFCEAIFDKPRKSRARIDPKKS